jgi:non-ribosomal peptide synthetase component F
LAPFLKNSFPLLIPRVTPLFQSSSILQNAPTINSRAGTFSAKTMFFDTQTAKCDLAVWVRMEDGVHMTLEYKRDLFREETITGMTGDYAAVLVATATHPERRVSELASAM